MVSLDIINMYPNIPTDEAAIAVIEMYLKLHINQTNLFGFQIKHVLMLLKFVLNNTYISHNQKFFLQLSGVGTGNHSSGSFAEIITDFTYIEAINRSNMSPHMLMTYVDDAWMVWTTGKELFEKFFTTHNTIWEGLEFEVEFENQRSLNFLDLTITILPDNSLKYQFYQKPTHSGKYLHFESHCSLQTKINIIRSETRRIVNNCSDRNDIWPHLEKMKSDFIKSGYDKILLNSNIIDALQPRNSPKNKPQTEPKYILKIPYINEAHTRVMRKIVKECDIDARVVVTAGKSLNTLISPPTTLECGSDQCTLCTNDIPCNTNHYGYKFQCNNCPSTDETYIGCSRRNVENRFKNHEGSVRRFNDRTSLGQHMIAAHTDLRPSEIKRGPVNFEQLFKSFKPEVIKKCRDTLDMYIWEGLLINNLP